MWFGLPPNLKYDYRHHDHEMVRGAHYSHIKQHGGVGDTLVVRKLQHKTNNSHLKELTEIVGKINYLKLINVILDQNWAVNTWIDWDMRIEIPHVLELSCAMIYGFL